MAQVKNKQELLITKEKAHAFGKDVYLLGQFSDGKKFYLEKASWDCGWYWGFGYIETYTNRSPETSKDIESHQHYDGLVGKHGSNYYHILSDNPEIMSTTLTKGDQWKLSDLMKTFYTLRKTAELFHMGNSHLTSTVSVDLKDKLLEDHINQVLLPKVFEAVYTLLEPETK